MSTFRKISYFTVFHSKEFEKYKYDIWTNDSNDMKTYNNLCATF